MVDEPLQIAHRKSNTTTRIKNEKLNFRGDNFESYARIVMVPGTYDIKVPDGSRAQQLI